MINYFAENISNFIKNIFGEFLNRGNFSIVTTPARRHKDRNFGELTASKIASILGLPFYPFCALATSKQRINAVFKPNNIPKEVNVIVFDDIVTTGSTFSSMKVLLNKYNKNLFFIAGINNKL